MADAFGFARDAMQVEVLIGVAQPDKVDKGQVAAVLPYGSATVIVEQGGLDIENDNGDTTVMANAAAVVYFDIAQGA